MNNVILVIEDNPDIRENINELLSISGYEVVTAQNGKDGLEEARKRKPDLILCDIIMPVLDGYGVLRALGNIPGLRGIPFVYLTSKTEKNDFRAAMDLGADDYLTKPFTGDELFRVVSARLNKEHHRAQNVQQAPIAWPDLRTHLVFDELTSLSPSHNIKKIRAKDVIYMEGDTATHLGYLVSGKLKTYKTNEWGKEYITELVAPGQFFGHLALLGDGTHQQTAVAIEGSEIALIPRDSFLEILSNNHSFSIRFLRFLSKGITDSENRLLHLAYNSARKRVAEALLLIYRQYGKGEDTNCTFPVNRENLSAIAGISPESVSRNLSDFKEEHLIETRNNTIRITNFSKLRQMRG